VPPAASVPSTSPAPTTARLSTPTRVLVVGDSLSDPKVAGGAFVTEALRGCPTVEVVNRARGGWMVNQMRRDLERAQPKLGRLSHAVVFGGVNDVYSDETAGRTPEKIIADLERIYALAKEQGASVIGVTIAPWGGFARYYNPKRAESTRTINAWIRARAESGELGGLVDAYALLSCGDAERLCPEHEPPFRDGLHFGPSGQKRLGEALAAAFAPCP
jgi:lysophospholipase L1-like esterase